jgi:phosphomannomutase/phosphoglucomutase
MQINQNIFRAYDIRGIASEDLSDEFVMSLGSALSHKIKKLGLKQVVVARDGRLSGARIYSALINSFLDNGVDVINAGMVPSPLLYFAVEKFNTKNGVMITGSHNPKEYNGFKIILGGKTIYGQEIQNIKNDILQGTHSKEIQKGNLEEINILDDYINELKNNISLKRSMKICLDCGNGVGGVIAPKAFKAIGCEVVELFSEVDGNFPNHHPDPGNPKNFEDLQSKIIESNADIGIALDGDADRVGIVDNSGKIIYPDIQMILYAGQVLEKNKNATIIFDVKCSNILKKFIEENSGIAYMSKTGHSYIKKNLFEKNALLAGEMSGHIFFKDRWFGFDDAIYAGSRMLEILSEKEKNSSDIFSELPQNLSTPEINISVSDENKFSIISKLIKILEKESGEINSLDGIRIDRDSCWGLIRASNTSPNLVLRFEGNSPQDLDDIKNVFKKAISKVDNTIKANF